MTNKVFWLKFILLVIAQALLCTYFSFSHLILMTIVPTLILCLPIATKTPIALFIAFFTGLVIDILSSGAVGITSASLLVVALTRKFILSILFGEEIHSRADRLSFRRQGGIKMWAAVLMVTAVFLLVYVILDSAGTRSFRFNATKFSLSLIFDFLLGFAVAFLLCSDRQ